MLIQSISKYQENRAYFSPVKAGLLYFIKENNMAKGKTSVFFCQECGYESAKWMGQCPACKEWNTFVEETVDKNVDKLVGKSKKNESKAAQVLPLSAVKSEKEERIVTGIAEFDRVLGGGIVRGSLVLVGGRSGYRKNPRFYFRYAGNFHKKRCHYFMCQVRNPCIR